MPGRRVNAIPFLVKVHFSPLHVSAFQILKQLQLSMLSHKTKRRLLSCHTSGYLSVGSLKFVQGSILIQLPSSLKQNNPQATNTTTIHQYNWFQRVGCFNSIVFLICCMYQQRNIGKCEFVFFGSVKSLPSNVRDTVTINFGPVYLWKLIGLYYKTAHMLNLNSIKMFGLYSSRQKEVITKQCCTLFRFLCPRNLISTVPSSEE